MAPDVFSKGVSDLGESVVEIELARIVTPVPGQIVLVDADTRLPSTGAEASSAGVEAGAITASTAASTSALVGSLLGAALAA